MMTIKNKSKTPQPVKALKKQQNTPQSAPAKGKGTPGVPGKGKSGGTPLTTRAAQKILPKQLVTPKSAAKSTPKGQKSTPKMPMKKGGSDGSDDDEDDDDDDEFLTGEDEMDSDDVDMSGDDSSDEPQPPPAKKADKKETPRAKLADTKTATPVQKGQKGTPSQKAATPARTEAPKTADTKPAPKGTPALKSTPAQKTATPAVKEGKTPKGTKQEAKSAEKVITKRDMGAGDAGNINLMDEIKTDEHRRAARDRRTLFVKNLPATADEAALGALSKDIEQVRIKAVYRRGKKVPSFGFLVFKSEESAKKQYNKLKGHKLGDRTLFFDFLGEKSTQGKKPDTKHLHPSELDPLKLYVTGFAAGTSAGDVKTLFPKSCDIVIPKIRDPRSTSGYCFVEFTTESLAKSAHDSVQGKTLKDRILTVMFARRKTEKALRKRKAEKNRKKKAQEQSSKAKKARMEEEEGDDLDDIDFDSDDDDDLSEGESLGEGEEEDEDDDDDDESD